MASMGKRIVRTFFLNSLIILIVVILFIWFVFEDMEDEVLAHDYKEQLELLRNNSQLKQQQYWQSGTLIAFFRPVNNSKIKMPDIFLDISIPFSGEVESQGKNYHVYSISKNEGDYFLAKDVSEFEQREALFVLMLIIFSITILVLNIILSIVANKRLIKPLKKLTYQIQQLTPENQLEQIKVDFADTELVEIANAFNRFIVEITSYIQRERTMISMAGHELKTPVSVILGALQIIEQRDQLTKADRKTFSRIQASSQEMRENIETLLMLSRRTKSDADQEVFFLEELLDELIDEAGFINPNNSQRIQKNIQESVTITTDVVLAKLLISNLIRNALNHTKGSILLSLTHDYLDILDQGEGLPKAIEKWMSQSPTQLPKQEGLGLYLVTLASEQLGWTIHSVNTEDWGHGIRLYFKK